MGDMVRAEHTVIPWSLTHFWNCHSRLKIPCFCQNNYLTRARMTFMLQQKHELPEGRKLRRSTKLMRSTMHHFHRHLHCSKIPPTQEQTIVPCKLLLHH